MTRIPLSTTGNRLAFCNCAPAIERHFHLPMRCPLIRYGSSMKSLQNLVLGLTLLLVGCAQNADRNKNLAGFSKESTGAHVPVRTTAYTHSESGHRMYGAHNAMGQRLQTGDLTSAAADWSRFPLGTKFRMLDDRKMYVIDDYGSALVGSNTIDLYMPSRRLMNLWGTRNVIIEITELGSNQKSLELLRPRKGNVHVRRMIQSIESKIKPESNS